MKNNFAGGRDWVMLMMVVGKGKGRGKPPPCYDNAMLRQRARRGVGQTRCPIYTAHKRLSVLGPSCFGTISSSPHHFIAPARPMPPLFLGGTHRQSKAA